jgi:hypothetical protein
MITDVNRTLNFRNIQPPVDHGLNLHDIEEIHIYFKLVDKLLESIHTYQVDDCSSAAASDHTFPEAPF